MKARMFGVVVFAGFLLATIASLSNSGLSYQQSFGNSADGAAADEKADSTVFAAKDGLIAIDLEGNSSQDQIAVVDPKARSIGVYQIDRQTGEISLKSVRKVHWDLQLDDYNGSKPIVRDIRSTVENNQRR